MEIRLIRAPWYAGADLLIRDGNAVATNITMEERTPGLVVKPSLQIDDTAAQTLMDDLWSAGYRPTEGAGSAGSLRATEKHLNDMRKIVSKQLDVSL